MFMQFKMAATKQCTKPASAKTENKVPNTDPQSEKNTVTNTHVGSARGPEWQEQMLKRVLMDNFCHVCDAVLVHESQRSSHYQGKKHVLKLRSYLQKLREQTTERPLVCGMPADGQRFCSLCNMVFSSAIVAKSHYDGKVHRKNLRKCGHTPNSENTPTFTVDSSSSAPYSSASAPSFSSAPAPSSSVPAPASSASCSPSAPSSSAPLGPEDDPERLCSLCDASFTHRQMALQHYSGRRHQRNLRRRSTAWELQLESVEHLHCSVCSTHFSSVEMFQAHSQGAKHMTRKRETEEMCRAQKKTYYSFTDELQDYIRVQQQRGVQPVTEEGRGHIRVQPVTEEGRGHIRVQPVTEEGRGHIRVQPVTEEGRGPIRVQPVTEEGRGHIRVQPVTEEGRGHIRVQPVTEEGRGHIRVQPVTEEGRGPIRVQPVTEEGRGHIRVQPVTEEGRGHIRVQPVTEEGRGHIRVQPVTSDGRGLQPHAPLNTRKRRWDCSPDSSSNSSTECRVRRCHTIALLSRREREALQQGEKHRSRKQKKKKKEAALDTRTEEEKLWDESILGLKQ